MFGMIGQGTELVSFITELIASSWNLFKFAVVWDGQCIWVDCLCFVLAEQQEEQQPDTKGHLSKYKCRQSIWKQVKWFSILVLTSWA